MDDRISRLTAGIASVLTAIVVAGVALAVSRDFAPYRSTSTEPGSQVITGPELSPAPIWWVGVLAGLIAGLAMWYFLVWLRGRRDSSADEPRPH